MGILDFSGEFVTESLIKYATERFIIESIELGKTNRKFDKFFQIKGLKY